MHAEAATLASESGGPGFNRRVTDNALDLTIVVPCLNEEERIGATLDTVAAAMSELPHSYEILVIDDGSTDQTAAIVEEYAQQHPNLPIRLHRNPRNRGLTRSFVDGAFLGRGSYYRLVCGDNAEPKDTLLAYFTETGERGHGHSISFDCRKKSPGSAERCRKPIPSWSTP